MTPSLRPNVPTRWGANVNARISPAVAADYAKASAYLRHSPTAAALLDDYEALDTDLLLSAEDKDAYSFAKNRLVWNPKRGGMLANGQESPALILAHEIQHAVDDHKHVLSKAEMQEDNFRMNFEAMLTDGKPTFIARAEVRATATEGKIAAELGEPVRKSYLDFAAFVDVTDPTQHRVNAPKPARHTRARKAA